MAGLYGGNAVMPVRRPRAMTTARMSPGQPTTAPRVSVGGPASRVGELRSGASAMAGQPLPRSRRRALGNTPTADGKGFRYSPAVSVLL
jgi:hypothetical protein